MYILMEIMGMFVLAATLGSILFFDVGGTILSKIPLLKAMV